MLNRLARFSQPGRRALATVEDVYKSRVPSGSIKVPTRVEDIESSNSLQFGAALDADHPGFTDQEYRLRRQMITDLAAKHRSMSEDIPVVDYTSQEISTWGQVLGKLEVLYQTHACSGFNRTYAMLNYKHNEIPQLRDISTTLKKTTGFQLRPVSGLLSPRDFLNGLAFRVFHSTQYIRHHSKPFYTPEPDICHELLGHVPMLLDPEFAELSEQIGRASLGVSDDDIKKLATVYWFSVEFGLLVEDGFLRAYGAGLLSSYGELYNALSGKPEYRPFDPPVTALQDYPITTFQPVLYVADSFKHATQQLQEFAKTLKRATDV